MALTKEQEALCLRAVRTYGPEAQWRHVQEECAELTAAINKRIRERISDDQLLDEVADVLIMAEQARQMLGAARVDRMVAKKMGRLKGRMDRHDAGLPRFNADELHPWDMGAENIK